VKSRRWRYWIVEERGNWTPYLEFSDEQRPLQNAPPRTQQTDSSQQRQDDRSSEPITRNFRYTPVPNRQIAVRHISSLHRPQIIEISPNRTMIYSADVTFSNVYEEIRKISPRVRRFRLQ